MYALELAGDWFNRLDWSLQSNNFGVGLPPASKNKGSWGLHRPLLADPALRPPPALIAHAKARRHLFASPFSRVQCGFYTDSRVAVGHRELTAAGDLQS